MESNKISIPLRGNDALAAIVTGLSTGDQVVLKEVTFTVDETTQELITGTIDEIKDAMVIAKPNPDAPLSEDEKNSPVMTVMASGGGPDTSRDAIY